MEYIIGIAFSIVIAIAARTIGFDRDRSFYPTLLIVIALLYVLFAAMAASERVLLIESLIAGIFFVIAVLGFKINLWLVVVALVGHGLFDIAHHFIIDNPVVPQWYPGFCMAVDVNLGIFLGILLLKRTKSSIDSTKIT